MVPICCSSIFRKFFVSIVEFFQVFQFSIFVIRLSEHPLVFTPRIMAAPWSSCSGVQFSRFSLCRSFLQFSSSFSFLVLTLLVQFSMCSSLSRFSSSPWCCSPSIFGTSVCLSTLGRPWVVRACVAAQSRYVRLVKSSSLGDVSLNSEA